MNQAAVSSRILFATNIHSLGSGIQQATKDFI